MALPTLDASFAEIASLPIKEALARWLVAKAGGTVSDYYTLPERYLYAKLAVAYGAPKDEASYISLDSDYAIGAMYEAVNGEFKDWNNKEALGRLAAAIRGDLADAGAVATYINWPYRYQLAAIVLQEETPAPAFDPTSISDMTLWLDGSDASTLYDASSGGSLVLADSPIARMDDKSGLGNHATQDILNNRPLRRLSLKNGLDAVEFDGSDDFLSGLEVLNTNQFSVFSVIRFLGDTEIGAYFTQQGSLPTLYRQTSGAVRVYDGVDLTSNATTDFSSWYIIGGVSDSLDTFIYFNGALDVTAPAGGSTMGGGYGIGSWLDGGQYQAAYIGEILVYNRGLSGTEIGQIHTYLNDKWGIY